MSPLDDEVGLEREALAIARVGGDGDEDRLVRRERLARVVGVGGEEAPLQHGDGKAECVGCRVHLETGAAFLVGGHAHRAAVGDLGFDDERMRVAVCRRRGERGGIGVLDVPVVERCHARVGVAIGRLGGHGQLFRADEAHLAGLERAVAVLLHDHAAEEAVVLLNLARLLIGVGLAQLARVQDGDSVGVGDGIGGFSVVERGDVRRRSRHGLEIGGIRHVEQIDGHLPAFHDVEGIGIAHARLVGVRHADEQLAAVAERDHGSGRGEQREEAPAGEDRSGCGGAVVRAHKGLLATGRAKGAKGTHLMAR